MNSEHNFELSERQKAVLHFIIESFSRDGLPIGSRMISKYYKGEPLSSATIRNVMSDLEEMGYLSQPHTSAGRIPTDLAYRQFVMDLIANRVFSFYQATKLQEDLEREGSIDGMLHALSGKISDYSGYVGLVLPPGISKIRCKKIHFVSINPNRVLAVFINNQDIVHNRVIEVEDYLTQDQLDRISNIVNEQFKNLTISQMLERIQVMLAEEKIKYDILLRKALELSSSGFKNLISEENDIYYAGTENLTEDRSFQDYYKLVDVYKAFEDKAKLLLLLKDCLEQEGINVSIGSENTLKEFDNFSLISASYSSQGRVLGALAILGPKRMKYDSALGIIYYSTRIVSDILTKHGF